MHDIEVISIRGLDAAIIGTTLRNGREVLAYDYDKAIAILMSHGFDMDKAEQFIAEAEAFHENGGPTFVYLDIHEEVHDTFPPAGTTFH